MKVARISGFGFVGAAVLVLVLYFLDVLEFPTPLVLGIFFLVGAAVSFGIAKAFGGLERSVVLVRELPSRGVRVRGRVKDALPYAAAHGGALIHPEGAQMVLAVELERAHGRTELATLLVVENSEAARARIGTEVVVLEHPDEPGLRAVEGFMPNGLPTSAR